MTQLGDEVLALKLRCCQGQRSSFPTAGRRLLFCTLCCYDVKGTQFATGNGARHHIQIFNEVILSRIYRMYLYEAIFLSLQIAVVTNSSEHRMVVKKFRNKIDIGE